MSSVNWHGRGNHQYNADVHIPLLYEVFENGDGIAEFAARADIAVQTFQEWKEKHPEFKQHYKSALSKGFAIWEKKPIEWAEKGLNINHQYWVAIMRNRYKYSQAQLKKEEVNTTASRLAAAWISMQKGGITPQEYNQIASGLATESKISELELQKQIIEQLQKSDNETKEMSDEQLKELSKAFLLIKTGKGRVVENG